MLAGRANFSVALGRSPSRPVSRADAGRAAQPLQAWQTITGSEGRNGWGARKGWPCGVGGSMGLARGMGAGCSATALDGDSTGTGNTAGAIFRLPPRGWSCGSMRIGGTGWSSILRKRNPS